MLVLVSISYSFIVILLIYIIAFTPNSTYTIWKKIRLIIITFKYSFNIKRDLLAQIKALNITEYKIPQVGKSLYIPLYY